MQHRALQETLGKLSALHLLVLALSVFVVIGIEYLSFQVTWIDVAVTIVTAALVEFIGQNFFLLLNRKAPMFRLPYSAFAAALGILIFLRASSPYYFAFASALAIASKYIIRFRGAHIFNPSNFGIVLTILLWSSNTTVDMTQWGSDPRLYFAVAFVAYFIAYRSGAIVTTTAFVASYTILLEILVHYVPRFYDSHHYGVLEPSLVLFSAFMITDPRTSPSGRSARILHGVAIASMSLILIGIGVRYALFLASFGITVLNLFSKQFMAAASARYSLRGLPMNMISFALVSTMFTWLLWSVVAHYPYQPLPGRLSPQYVLFGTESDGGGMCGSSPVFTAANDDLALHAETEGVAWGGHRWRLI